MNTQVINVEKIIALFYKEQMRYLKLIHISKIEPMHLQVIYKTLWLYKHENLFLLYENWYNTSNLI